MKSPYQPPTSGSVAKEMVAEWPLRQGMRRLWADHVFYTRLYIIAAVNGTEDAQATAARLLRNQEDIGHAIVPYYGQDAGNALTELLKEHIMIAVDLVNAALANDNDKVAQVDKKWRDNADDIARFLSKANPNWPFKEVQDLLYLHLSLTKDEAVFRIKKSWEEDIRNFDQIFTEAMLIADTPSEGSLDNSRTDSARSKVLSLGNERAHGVSA